MKVNPRKTEIFGYESPSCLENLISLMIGMIEKDPIPPVKLCTFDNGQTYSIAYPGIENLTGADGGHHRILAAYLLSEELEFEVVESLYKKEIPTTHRILIDHIRIKSNPETFHFEKDVLGKDYRELPSADEFFSKYIKINYALKYGTHTNYSLQKNSYQNILNQLEELIFINKLFKENTSPPLNGNY